MNDEQISEKLQNLAEDAVPDDDGAIYAFLIVTYCNARARQHVARIVTEVLADDQLAKSLRRYWRNKPPRRTTVRRLRRYAGATNVRRIIGPAHS